MFPSEIEWAESLDFAKVDATNFFEEYVWAVLNAGMKMQVARGIFRKVFGIDDDHPDGNGFHPEVVGHPLKRRAVERGMKEYLHWFERLKEIHDMKQRIEYLDSLPHIGPITRYHFAENLGIDVAKPDRWLLRIAFKFGYASTPELEKMTERDVEGIQRMCALLSDEKGQRIRTVDLVMWRWCNGNGL